VEKEGDTRQKFKLMKMGDGLPMKIRGREGVEERIN